MNLINRIVNLFGLHLVNEATRNRLEERLERYEKMEKLVRSNIWASMNQREKIYVRPLVELLYGDHVESTQDKITEALTKKLRSN